MGKTKHIVFVLLLISSTLFANEIKWQIKGKVVENQTNESIPYASIAIYNLKDSTVVTGTMTDEEGNFTIKRLNEGNYYLEVSFMGYKSHRIDLSKLSSKLNSFDLGIIKLNPEAALLDEVEVKSTSKTIKNYVDRQVLDVSANLSASGGSAVDALKLSPSIQTDSDGNVKLRGSSNFRVLINGKPTSLTSKEVLKQTPANAIQKIEVITNPSVKYSAEGGAGIINIILKKGLDGSFNGMVNASIGTRNKFGGDATFNLNKEKTSYSFSFDWKDHTNTALNDYYRTLREPNQTHYATMFQDRDMNEKNLGFRFGLDYTPNKKHNFTYGFHTGYTNFIGDIKVKTSGKTIPTSTTENNNNRFFIDIKPTFFSNNVGYQKNIDTLGSKINVNAYYSYIDYNIYNLQNLAKADINHNTIDLQPFKQEILNKNNSNDLKVDLDYTKALDNNAKLETGVSYHLYNRFLNIRYSTFDYGVNDWKDNPLYTNKYNYDETIYATYLNYNSSFWGLTTSFGLRVEYMDRLLHQQGSTINYKFDNFNFFPGVSISKQIDDFKSMKFVITNRINRPDEYMMNPFPEFEDDYFYAEGNPYLIPEIVRNYEFGYNYTKNGLTLSSNFYYRTTTDKLDQKLTIGSDKKIHTIFHNDSNDKSLGVELMGNFKVTNWWSLNANTNIFHYDVSANIDETMVNNKNLSWSSQLVNSIDLGKETSLQVIGYYASKTARSQGDLSSFYFVDLALKQQFLDGKLSVNLQLKDVFQSRNYILKTNTANMDLSGYFNNESPIFFLNVSYNFSQFKKKTKDVHTEFDM